MLSARERFRLAGRQVLRTPGDRMAHEARVQLACKLEGAEPLQGALADLLCACPPDVARSISLLQRPEVSERLSPFVSRGLGAQVSSGQRLARVSPWATRYSVLAMPSLDVPQRAILCAVDDSRVIATQVVAAMLRGDMDAETAFLSHCEGAGDTLAFMLARRMLTRKGHALSPRWEEVSLALQYHGGHG